MATSCAYREHADLECEGVPNVQIDNRREDNHSEGQVSDSDGDDTANLEQRNLTEADNRPSRVETHVWRKVAEEGVASSLIDQLAVDETAETEKTRGVETYNFKAKFDDPRPDPELPELGESDALKRLRQETGGVRARLGKRRREPEANLEVDIELARIERSKILDDGDPDQVRFTKELAERLKEPNLVLLAHAVSLLGIEHCRRLLQMTETVEEAGGLMTRDGSRRRSAGGVFLQLVKEDKSLTKAQLRSLFQPHHALIKRKNKRMRTLRKAHDALDKLEKALES